MKATAYARTVGTILSAEDLIAQQSVEENTRIKEEVFARQDIKNLLEKPENSLVVKKLENLVVELEQFCHTLVLHETPSSEFQITLWSHMNTVARLRKFISELSEPVISTE